MAGNEKKSQPGPRGGRKVRRRLNWKGALIALAAVVLTVGGGWLLYSFQEVRRARTNIDLALRLESDGKPIEAIQHLRRLFDQSSRTEADVLPELTRLMDLPAVRGAFPFEDVVRFNERLLTLNPSGPQQALALRRLVRANLGAAISVRDAKTSGKLNAQERGERDRLTIAEKLLGQLQTAEKKAREQGHPCPADEESQTYVLQAITLELRSPERSAKTPELAKAVECLSKALDLAPTNADAAAEAVQIELNQNDLEGASRFIDRLADAAPDSFVVPRLRAIVAQRQGHDDEVRKQLAEAQRLAPDNLEIRLALIADAIHRQDMPEARRLFAEVPEEQRGHPRVALVEVEISLAENRAEKAQELLRGLNLASGGTDIDVMVRLIDLYNQTGQISKARTLLGNLRRQVAIPSQIQVVDFLDAEQLHKMGRHAEARKILLELQQAGFSDNTDRDVQKYRLRFTLALAGCHEGLGESDKAGEVYRAALVANPDSPVLERTYGEWLRSRDPEKAVALLEKGDKTTEKSLYQRVAMTTAKLEKQWSLPVSKRSWTEVDAEIEALLKQDPDSVRALLLKARRQVATPDLEAALATLKDVTTRAPRDSEGWFFQSEVLAQMGKGDEALALLERAARPDALDDSVECRLQRARLLIRFNRGREARALMLADLKDLTESNQAARWQAMTKLDLQRGDLAEAREDLKNWSRLEASDPRPTQISLDLAIQSDDGPGADALLEHLESVLASSAEPSDAGTRAGAARNDPIYRTARAAVLVGLSPKSGSRLDEFQRTESQRFQAARDEVREVLKQFPSMPQALQLDAEIAARLLANDRRNGPVGSDRERAVIDAYRKALDAGAFDALPRLVNFLASSRRFSDLDDPKLKLPATAGPHNRDRLAAEACARAGAKDEAIRFAERYVAANQSSPESIKWKAEMLAMLGQGELVEADVQRLIEQKPTDLGPWIALVQLRARRGRAADVDALIQKAQEKVTDVKPEMVEVACRWALRDVARTDQAYQRAFDRYPEDNDVALLAGNYYQETGRPSLAEKKFREVLRRDPANRVAIRNLAILATAPGQPAGRWQEAWDSLGSVSDGQTESIDDRYTRARLLLRSSESETRRRGIAQMKDLLADIPINSNGGVSGRTELINGYLLEQDHGPAIEVAAEMMTKMPSTLALALHAETLLKGGRRDEALAKLDELARLAPGNPTEAQLRILYLWDPKQPEVSAEALDALHAARTQSDPRAAEPLGLAIIPVLEGAGKLDAVRDRIVARLIEQNPGLSWLAARAATRAGDKDRVLDLCETTVSKGSANDRNEASNILIALAYDNADPALRKRAETIVDAALKADRTAYTPRFARAMMHHILGRYDEEIKIYRELLADRMENGNLLNNLAWALCEFQRKPEEALTFANQAIERYGNSPSLLDTRGVIYTRLNDRERALADLAAAVERQPTPSRRFHLARALALGGDSAIEQVRKERDQAIQDGLKVDAMEPREKADLEALRKL